MKRNLFIIDDYVKPQKDAIYQTLKNKKKDYLFLNAQPFCNDVFEPRFYRQKLLGLCRDVSEQLNMDIAICGALSPQVKLLDITEMSDELVADTIDRWIVSHSSHNLQHQE